MIEACLLEHRLCVFITFLAVAGSGQGVPVKVPYGAGIQFTLVYVPVAALGVLCLAVHHQFLDEPEVHQ